MLWLLLLLLLRLRLLLRTQFSGFMEIAEGDETLLHFDIPERGVSRDVGYVNNSKTKHTFKFNSILSMSDQQPKVFDRVGVDAVQSVLSGVNSTIFAYVAQASLSPSIPPCMSASLSVRLPASLMSPPCSLAPLPSPSFPATLLPLADTDKQAVVRPTQSPAGWIATRSGV